jgi:hypothetical protein
MIKALLLILAPAATWERIARSRRNVAYVLLLYLVPVAALSILIEIAGHNFLAPRFTEQGVKVIPRNLALQYGGIELGVGVGIAIIIGLLIQLCAKTFHNRNTFAQCFAIAGYALGPFYLFHILVAIPVLSQWIPFAFGVVFSFATMYHAIPHVLKPDPPHAFGLFVMSGFVLTMLSFIGRMILILAVPAQVHLH